MSQFNFTIFNFVSILFCSKDLPGSNRDNRIHPHVGAQFYFGTRKMKTTEMNNKPYIEIINSESWVVPSCSLHLVTYRDERVHAGEVWPEFGGGCICPLVALLVESGEAG